MKKMKKYCIVLAICFICIVPVSLVSASKSKVDSINDVDVSIIGGFGIFMRVAKTGSEDIDNVFSFKIRAEPTEKLMSMMVKRGSITVYATSSGNLDEGIAGYYEHISPLCFGILLIASTIEVNVYFDSDIIASKQGTMRLGFVSFN